MVEDLFSLTQACNGRRHHSEIIPARLRSDSRGCDTLDKAATIAGI